MGLTLIFPSHDRKPVYGLSLVLLVRMNGRLHAPLGIRLWHKGGPSTNELALELLSYARNRLCCLPEYVLFDMRYPLRYS
jgi:hypothetical protein